MLIRKYHYNVLTPMNRLENLPHLMKMLRDQIVSWYVVMDSDSPISIESMETWMKFCRVYNTHKEFYSRCNYSLNAMLDYFVDIKDDHRYCFLNDDDAYEPGFFDKLDKAEGEVLITSMLRGNRTPGGVAAERAHGTDTLIASPDHMVVGRVSVEQIIMSGRIMRKTRLPLHICGDGQMIEYVTKTNPVVYLPEAHVWFNYYEPGRWDK
jgi:hypothetical protein